MPVGRFMPVPRAGSTRAAASPRTAAVGHKLYTSSSLAVNVVVDLGATSPSGCAEGAWRTQLVTSVLRPPHGASADLLEQTVMRGIEGFWLAPRGRLRPPAVPNAQPLATTWVPWAHGIVEGAALVEPNAVFVKNRLVVVTPAESREVTSG